MWKKLGVLCLVATSVAGFRLDSARAATAIVQDTSNTVYRSSRSTLGQAFVESLIYCQIQGGSGCTVIATNPSSGFGAVAQSASRYGFAMGHRTQAAADRAALDACVSQTPPNETCRITLQFYDGTGSQP